MTPAGLVTAKTAGETHVMIRFGGQAEVARVTLPFARIASYPDVPANNFIDTKLVAAWKALGLTPSPLCPDDEFLRRLYLDAIGTLPTPDEVRAFLADTDPQKRQKAVDKVLERPEFVDWWALKWGDLLRINRTALEEKGMWSFHNWVRAALRDAMPIDKMVREIITAEGSTFTEGPANFYLTARTPTDWSETTSMRTSLGSVPCSTLMRSMTRSTTFTVFVPDCLRIERITVDSPSYVATLARSSCPSSTRATSPTRTGAPLVARMTMRWGL